MTNFITSWLVYDMTNFGCDKRFGAMTYVTLIDVMTNILTSWNFLTTWCTFWRLDALFDVMSNFMTPWCVATFCWHDVFLTPWPAFCLLDIFIFIISGTKYNENVFLIYYNTLLDVMICFSCYDELFDVMTCFIFMTNCLTLWRHDKPFAVMVCFWCHDELGTLWRHDKLCDVITGFFLPFMINFVIKSNDELIEVMMKLLTSWRTFWHHEEFVMWQTIDVMTCVALIDARNVSTTWRILLTSWQTFWPLD